MDRYFHLNPSPHVALHGSCFQWVTLQSTFSLTSPWLTSEYDRRLFVICPAWVRKELERWLQIYSNRCPIYLHMFEGTSLPTQSCSGPGIQYRRRCRTREFPSYSTSDSQASICRSSLSVLWNRTLWSGKSAISKGDSLKQWVTYEACRRYRSRMVCFPGRTVLALLNPSRSTGAPCQKYPANRRRSTHLRPRHHHRRHCYYVDCFSSLICDTVSLFSAHLRLQYSWGTLEF